MTSESLLGRYFSTHISWSELNVAWVLVSASFFSCCSSSFTSSSSCCTLTKISYLSPSFSGSLRPRRDSIEIEKWVFARAPQFEVVVNTVGYVSISFGLAGQSSYQSTSCHAPLSYLGNEDMDPALAKLYQGLSST